MDNLEEPLKGALNMANTPARLADERQGRDAGHEGPGSDARGHDAATGAPGWCIAPVLSHAA